MYPQTEMKLRILVQSTNPVWICQNKGRILILTLKNAVKGFKKLVIPHEKPTSKARALYTTSTIINDLALAMVGIAIWGTSFFYICVGHSNMDLSVLWSA